MTSFVGMDFAGTTHRRDINAWVTFFKTAEIPVLQQTAQQVADLKDRGDNISARDIMPVVMNDPMMAFKVIDYAQNHRSSHQIQELVQVEQAILMMGTNAFFNKIIIVRSVEDLLIHDAFALDMVLKLLSRAYRASFFATEFAAHLKDFQAETVRVATLLHELAEILMWCFDPQSMRQIALRQEADSTLRSKAAQEQVLGFKLVDLQLALIHAFNMPALLENLMDEEHQHTQRVKNVHYAVNLARHSASGWDNPALPDDFKDIAELLHVDVSRVLHIVGLPQN